MQDFSIDLCTYSDEPKKSMHPAYAFRMSARDMLRFGVLYQRSGTWLGKRIIPAEWIGTSTQPYSLVDEASGLSYGLMWNVIPVGSPMAEGLGTTGFFHTGVGVHALVILPEWKLVIVERIDTDGPWVDPGEAGMALGMMIAQAREDDGP
jgi:CubicO group peptidase (beta-lactamase class C family)